MKQLSRALKERDEARAFQAATNEILTAISRSASDAKPVFEAIVDCVRRLFGTRYAAVFLVKGEELHLAAAKSDPGFARQTAAAFRRFRESFPQRIDWGGFTGKALRSGKVSQMAPVIGNPKATREAVKLAKEFGYNAVLLAPLMRDGKAIGAIGTTRPEAKPFAARELALFKAFAAQAVIAIENARLSNETKEALEQQTAIGEVLRVISSSPADVQPVLEAVAVRAARICDATDARIFLVEGEHYKNAAGFGDVGVTNQVIRLNRDTPSGRAIIDRAPQHIHDIAARSDFSLGREIAGRVGWRTILSIPLLREDRALGTIVLRRKEVRPFSDKQIELLKTFADQAAIAIENARLFNETKESLERQTATAEILRVISTTPTDTQPVFDAIVKNCSTLFMDGRVLLRLVEDGRLVAKASVGEDAPPIPIDRDSGAGTCVLDRRTVHFPDLAEAAKQYPRVRPLALKLGYRSGIFSPLMRGGEAIGMISVLRRAQGAFDDKEIRLLGTFADQAVIAIENARLFNETREALERQTATADILKVTSASPTDVQPVFDAIAERAAILCSAKIGVVTKFDGELLHLVAFYGASPELVEPIRAIYPLRPGSDTTTARAVRDRAPAQIPDLLADPDYVPKQASVQAGYRSNVAVPLLREGKVIGAISVARAETGAFSDKEIGLLKTFADQAVIAIENVRLFNETKEALERQTATSEILRVISSSPADIQPVFDSIIEHAMRLCDAHLGTVGLYDGKSYRHVAQRGGSPEYVKFLFSEPFAPEPAYTLGRMIAEQSPVHLADYRELPAYRRGDPRAVATVELGMARTFLAVPMIKEGRVIGGITLRRPEVRPFTQKQIDLVSTFANQAVIAIENVRLFNETKEALERQTGTAEILKVIASSPTDVQPVFDVIVDRAVRLCGARFGRVYRYDGATIQLVASSGLSASGVAEVQRVFPRPAADDSIVGQVILSRAPRFVPDIQRDRTVPELSRQLIKALNTRSQVSMPMLRAGQPIGAMTIGWDRPEGYDERKVALLHTFADQAVIAIENVRLFNETKEALEQQTAISEVLRVISGSPADVRPVLEAVAERAMRICEASNARIFLAERAGLRCAVELGGMEGVKAGELMPLDRGWITGRAVIDRAVTHIVDAAALPPEEYPLGRNLQGRFGHRTVLVVPLMREQEALGAILLRRREVRPFSDKQIALLKTFADQAAIAIENVRLFNETKEALEQQTATAEILRVISSSPTDIQPVLDAVASTAARLCGASDAVIRRVDGDVLQLAAKYGAILADSNARPIDRGSVSGRAVLERQTIHIYDVLDDAELRFTREMARRHGFRTVLSTPLLREGQPIGTISIRRPEARLFSDSEVKLLQTFADQAVIAIENVRLFKELQERTEALTKSVGQLTALGEVGRAIGSTLELDEVLRTIVQRAVQLAGLDSGSIYEFDERDERFHLRAAEHVDEEILAVSRKSPIGLGEGAVGRAGATREPVVVEDVLDESYRSRVRELLIKAGSRALLAVPLLREDHLLGALVVSRKSPGPFAPEAVELLKTFATQSAVAIQNARLFREIEEKSTQLEEASRHKSQFLASMSHELRTPLNAILGFNEMILGQVYGEVPRDMQEPLEDIQKSGKHLLRLINNVLDLAKIEAGRMELALADYSVQDTVESVRATLRPLAEAKGLELVTSVPQDIPLAYGDGGRLTQCLMNLAGNSLKFTKQGRVEITVRANNGRLTWRVSDTGIGIPPDKIETLFSEFRQTDATIASEYGGTGLGLSITKKFVEMHGGRISVESEPGKGSAFTIEIPLRATARP